MNKNRKIVVAGNWKMNLTLDESSEFILDIHDSIPSKKQIETIIFPQFPTLNLLLKSKSKNLFIGAQNMHYKDAGAYTGEVSPVLLKQLTVTHVLIGHSERRQYFNETNETVNLKILSAISHELIPVFCVGESLDIRQKGTTNRFVKKQIVEGLKNVTEADLEKVIIAYEPIWAIGTGVTATSEQANDTIKAIRKTVSSLYGKTVAQKVRILYGGSVNTTNIKELLLMSDIDGVLVGGASIKVASFESLIKQTLELL